MTDLKLKVLYSKYAPPARSEQEEECARGLEMLELHLPSRMCNVLLVLNVV